MTMIEVRCCCQPTKLLGWLPFGDRAYMPAEMNYVLVELGDGSPLRLDLKRADESLPGARSVRITLPVGYFGTGLGSRPALKSEETPLATLRKIRGFIENPTPSEPFVDDVPFEVVR